MIEYFRFVEADQVMDYYIWGPNVLKQERPTLFKVRDCLMIVEWTEDVHLDVVRADVDVILGSPVRTLVHNEPLLRPLQLVAQSDGDDLKCRDTQDQSFEVTCYFPRGQVADSCTG